jgi:thiamine-phosphate pyrophosphorylase
MHKKLPKIFIFIDKYNSEIFKNKNINIGIVYRNYKDENRENQLIRIAEACKKSRYQLFVSNDLKLAYKFKADGIYIPSFNKSKKFSNIEKRNIKIIGSAHSQKEIHKKIEQNCKAIFLSPLFCTKKTKCYLNLYKFNYLSLLNKTNILALGGISENNIRKLKLLSIKGFGGIRFFKKKPASKRPVFIKKNFF